MRFWTIQSKEVRDIANENEYLPLISKSRYVNYNHEFAQLYSYIVHNFNRINNCNYRGVVFGFAKNINNQISTCQKILCICGTHFACVPDHANYRSKPYKATKN